VTSSSPRGRDPRAFGPLRDPAGLRPVDHGAGRGPRSLLARSDRRRAHRRGAVGQGRPPRDDRDGERPVTVHGTRRASRQDLQRRHQLLVVATGWGRRTSAATLSLLAVMDSMEFLLALIGGDTDRAGAILGSWRWLLRNRRSVFASVARSSFDPGALRRGTSPAPGRRGQPPQALRGDPGARRPRPGPRAYCPVSEDEPAIVVDEGEAAGVGFGAAFSENEEFDEIPESASIELRRQPSRC
jgi:hypothetical protein